jgi:hypothetical protein
MLAAQGPYGCPIWEQNGAARLGQAASDAVIGTVRRPVTWAKAVTCLFGRWSTVLHRGVSSILSSTKPAAQRHDPQP